MYELVLGKLVLTKRDNGTQWRRLCNVTARSIREYGGVVA